MGYSGTKNIPGLSAMEMLSHLNTYYVGEKWTAERANYEIIAGQPGKGGVWFIVRMTMNETGEVFDFATIVLISRDTKEFCWKAVSEFSGPNETSMPKALFNRLTPLEKLPAGEHESHARGWRDTQRAAYENQAVAKTLGPKVGDVIVFRDPIPFTLSGNCCEVARFRVREWGRKRRLVALVDEKPTFAAKLSRPVWDNNPFEVEGRQIAVVQAVELSSHVPQPQAQQVALF